MAYKILKIEGFQTKWPLEDGEVVFYIKAHKSPNIKLSVGKFYNDDGNGNHHVVDILDNKKRYPYTSEIIPIDNFKASYLRQVWQEVDNWGNPVENKKE